MICLLRFENESIISQVVGISEVCDQNGERVSKSTKVAIFVVKEKRDF